MSDSPTPTPPLAVPGELARRLGARLVSDFLLAADAAGRHDLPRDEDAVFGFLQRVLSRLRNGEGGGYGLIFPKRDPDYQKFFDYFDGEGRIYVVYPELAPEGGTTAHADATRLRIDPHWVLVSEDSQEIAPHAPREIVLRFLSAYAALRLAAEGA